MAEEKEWQKRVEKLEVQKLVLERSEERSSYNE